MQMYDVFMLVVLIGAFAFGAWKGMARQIASLASVILSAAAAIHFSPQLAPMISKQEPWNRYLAMLIIYVGVSLIIWIIFRYVSAIIDRIKLNEFDHQMGALFGLIKGALLCIVITFFTVMLSEDARQVVLQSKSGKMIAVVTRHANPVLPKDVRDAIGKYVDELDRKLDPNSLGGTSGGLFSFGKDSQKSESPLESLKQDAASLLDSKLNERSRGGASDSKR